MNYTISFFLLFVFLFSCKENDNFQKYENINISDEKDITSFIVFFLNNQNVNDKNNSILNIKDYEFLENKLQKYLLPTDRKNWLLSETEIDSVFTTEDWDYIKEQYKDNKEYFLYQKNFTQKIINTDTLTKENYKFLDWQDKKIDSLVNTDIVKAKEYVSRTKQLEYYNYIKKFTPILTINKPLFFKDKRKVIFSYFRYSGPLAAYSETAIYEFKDNKWHKIGIISMLIS